MMIKKIICKRKSTRGVAILNKLINNLPFELHILGYNCCGPGTNLDKRLARGACKEHDIAYSNSNDIKGRHFADKILDETAIARLKAKDATFGEKTAALAISSAIKIKRKLGMGLRRRTRQHNKM